jgi:hypothetical protein
VQGSLRRRIAAGGLVVVPLATACYAYRPLGNPAPRMGAEVRATFAEPLPVQLGEVTIRDVKTVEGQVYSANRDTVLVWGMWVHTLAGSRYSAKGGSFTLSRDRIASLEERRFSAARSGAAALIVAGLVAGLFTLVEGALGGSSDGGQPPTPF